MNIRTWKILLLLLPVWLSVGHAAIRQIEQAFELRPAQLELPARADAQLTVRPCNGCPVVALRVTAATQWYAAPANSSLPVRQQYWSFTGQPAAIHRRSSTCTMNRRRCGSVAWCSTCRVGAGADEQACATFTGDWPNAAITDRVLCTLVLLGTALPLYADDSELFLSDRSVTTTDANVLFIIDTSGSMNTLVDTQAPFDPDTSFTGCYRSDALYYTTTGTLPPCDSPDLMLKSVNYCAASAQALAEVGYYADFLLGWDYSRERWDALNGERADDPVECVTDRGVHGLGADSEPFAANGTEGPWAVSDAQEPAWTNRYTIYDGELAQLEYQSAISTENAVLISSRMPSTTSPPASETSGLA